MRTTAAHALRAATDRGWVRSARPGGRSGAARRCRRAGGSMLAKTAKRLLPIIALTPPAIALADVQDLATCTQNLPTSERIEVFRSLDWSTASEYETVSAAAIFLGNVDNEASSSDALETMEWANGLVEGIDFGTLLANGPTFVFLKENGAGQATCLVVSKEPKINADILKVLLDDLRKSNGLWRAQGITERTRIRVSLALNDFEKQVGMTLPFRMTASFVTQ